MENKFTFNTQYQVDKARALRKKGTKAEKLLWEALRNRKVSGIKFRRQHPLSNYIVDFCSPELKLIIEIDGNIHDLEVNKEYDIFRQGELENSCYKILRFKNNEIISNLLNVIIIIEKSIAKLQNAV